VTAPLPPYAEFLGLRAEGGLVVMPYAERLLGAPGRLHGGVVAGLLEIAANLAAEAACADEKARVKPINVTVDYYRGGAMADTYAEARVLRAGRRVMNIHAEAWQSKRSKPIAAATVNLLIVRERAPAETPAETPEAP